MVKRLAFILAAVLILFFSQQADRRVAYAQQSVTSVPLQNISPFDSTKPIMQLYCGTNQPGLGTNMMEWQPASNQQWQDPTRSHSPECYVDCNGQLHCTTGCAAAFSSGCGSTSNTFYNVKASPYNATGNGTTDDTVAITAAINAAIAGGGGTILFPQGTYLTSSPLPFAPGITYEGVGQGSPDTVLVSIIENKTSDLFVPTRGTSGAIVQYLALVSNVGGGNIFNFNGWNVTRSTFRNDVMIQKNAGESIISSVCTPGADCNGTDTLTGYFGNWMELSDLYYAAANSVPAIYLMNSVINENTFEKMRITGTPTAANYAIWIENTNTSSYAYNTTIRQITWEEPYGGAVNLLSSSGAKIAESKVYDMVSAPTAPIYNVGTHAGGTVSLNTMFDSIEGSGPATATFPDIGITNAGRTEIQNSTGYVSGIGGCANANVFNNAIVATNLAQVGTNVFVTNGSLDFYECGTGFANYSIVPGSTGNFIGDLLFYQNGSIIGKILTSANLLWGSYLALEESGVIQNTIPTGTAPLSITSTTPVANLTTEPPVVLTATNCTSAASPAVCAAAPAGAVVIAASATTVVVDTTAVTALSDIIISEDSSMGGRLSSTCNTTLGRTYAVTARTTATNFTITSSAAPTTNPACLSYVILN